MKHFYLIILVLFITQCASNKTYNSLKTETAVFYENSKIIEIELEPSEKKDFKHLFFRNLKAPITIEIQNDKTILKASFKKQAIRDFNLHANPKIEYGNNPNHQNKPLRFKLKKNEAIISYKTTNGFQYQKIKNIKTTF